MNLPHLGLTLPALKLVAQTPAGKAELRQMRDKLIAGRDTLVAEYEERLAKADKLLENMNLVLGEVQA